MEIKYKLVGQELIRQDQQKLAEGAINTIQIVIDFQGQYSSYAKIGRFEGLNGSYDCAFDDNKVVIPWEVLIAPNFKFSVLMVSSDDGTYVMTTKKISIKVYDSITIAERDPLPENTASYIEQMFQLVNYSKTVGDMLLRWAREGKFNGKDGTYIIERIDAGFCACYIHPTTGHLIMVYDDGQTPLPLSIKEQKDGSGHLIYTYTHD